MKRRDPRILVEDLLLYARRVKRHVALAGELDRLLADEVLQDAVLRGFEVLGEIARRLPQSLKEQAPNIPWPQIIGMRNIIAHDYYLIDWQQVLDTGGQPLDLLIEQTAQLLEELGGPVPD